MIILIMFMVILMIMLIAFSMVMPACIIYASTWVMFYILLLIVQIKNKDRGKANILLTVSIL